MHSKAKREYLRLLTEEAMRISGHRFAEGAEKTIHKFVMENFEVSDLTGDVIGVGEGAYTIKDYVGTLLPQKEPYLLQTKPKRRVYKNYSHLDTSKLSEAELWKLAATEYEEVE